MILVDTSVIIPWLDRTHSEHEKCLRALESCGNADALAISSVTFAELAGGGRSQDALNEDLQGFARINLDFNAAFRAGLAFRQSRPGKAEGKPILADFLIRGQAASRGLRHLTNDRRRVRLFPDVEFLFPDDSV